MRRSDVRTTLEQAEADLTTLDNGLADTFDRVREWCNTGIASSPPGGPAGRTHGTSPTERAALGPRDVFARDLANAEADLQILRDAMRRLAAFTQATHGTRTRATPSTRNGESDQLAKNRCTFSS